MSCKALDWSSKLTLDTFEELYKNYNQKTYSPNAFSDLEKTIQICENYYEGLPIPEEFHEYIPSIAAYGEFLFNKDADPVKEVCESIDMVAVCNLWNKNKQILTIDDDFAKELANTDGLKIPIDIDKQLPFTTFCLDVTNNEFFKDTDLLFITLNMRKGNLYLHVHRIFKDLFFPMIVRIEDGMVIEENDFKYYPYKREYIEKCDGVLPISNEAKFTHGNIKIANDNFEDFCMFIFQLLLYMSAANKDVKENPVTKKTYKKPKNGIIKNKFSEIQQWDVGYVIGNAIKVSKKKIKEENDNESKQEIKEIKTENKTHRTVRPHYRRAHWHRYYIGKRDGSEERKMITKWLPPSFVNAASEKDILPTIREIKK